MSNAEEQLFVVYGRLVKLFHKKRDLSGLTEEEEIAYRECLKAIAAKAKFSKTFYEGLEQDETD